MAIDLNAPIETVQAMTNEFLGRIPQIIMGIIVLVAFYYIGKLLRAMTRKFSLRYQGHQNLGLVLGRFAQLIVVALGIFIAVTIIVPSIHASNIIQLLGVSSIAIGFAFKDIFQNFLAGILILINQPFQLRDQIRVGEFEGTVEDIQTRATMLRTYDNRRIVIPNAKVFTDSVVVNTAFAHRRSEAIIGIGYGDDIEKAKSIIEAAIQSVSGILKEPACDTVVTEFAGSSVNIRARWWSKPDIASVLVVQDRVLTAIKSQLSAAGIDLPFPTRQILFHDQTEDGDGDRAQQREGWPAPAPDSAKA